MHLINLDTIIVGLNLIYLGLNKLHPLCWALIWIFQAQNWQIPWKFKNKTFLKFFENFLKNSKIRKFSGRLWKFPTSCNQANFDRKSEVLKWTNKIIVCLMLHCNPYHVNNKLYILRLNHWTYRINVDFNYYTVSKASNMTYKEMSKVKLWFSPTRLPTDTS